MNPRPLLLVDLDGVVVLEASESQSWNAEILVLHRRLGPMFEQAGQRAIILTHRSRREARQLVLAAGLRHDHFISILAAEDLLIAALGRFQWRRALSRGLQKAFILQRAEKLAGVDRDFMAMVDDRQHNLDALLEAGIGLALKAPSGLGADGRSVVTFDMASMLDRLPSWHGRRHENPQIDLAPVEHDIHRWQRSGLSTQSLKRGVFNRCRGLASSFRKSNKALFENW